MTSLALVRNFAQRLEMDRTVLYGIMTRLWSLAAGPITAILIANRFTQTAQGFYYTFGSILALQTFAELGIGVAITQFASHEWAKLRLATSGHIEGDPTALSRLASLTRIAVKWYGIVSVLIVLGLSLGGYIFFRRQPATDVLWTLPWFTLCVLSGANLLTIPLWSLLEGCNQVQSVYGYRLVQGILGSTVVWTAISLGAELWTASILTLVNLLYAAGFLWQRYRRFLATLLGAHEAGATISWRNEILPFQWRIAVSWISGYFTFSLFTPVLFAHHGPVIAGQMGMTWSLVSVISMIGSSWISPRAPTFGILIAERRYAELDALFWRLTGIIVVMATFGAIAITILVFALNRYEIRYAARLLPLKPTVMFLAGTIAYTVISPMAVYLRAHKREPLMMASIILGVVIGLSTYLLGRSYGATGMAAGYFVAFTSNVPLVAFIWNRCRHEWHAAPEGDA